MSETVTGGLARPEGPGNKMWYNRVTIITQKKRIKMRNEITRQGSTKILSLYKIGVEISFIFRKYHILMYRVKFSQTINAKSLCNRAHFVD